MKTDVQERIERIVTNELGYREETGYRVPDTALYLQMKLCEIEGSEWIKPHEIAPLLESFGFRWTRFLVVQPVGMHKTICSMKKQGYEVEIAPAFSMSLKPTYIEGMISVYIRNNK